MNDDRVLAEVEFVMGDVVARRPVRIAVGFCLIYEGGPHVLMTLSQNRLQLMELSLTPDQADLIADRLKGMASEMRRDEVRQIIADAIGEED